MAGEILSQRVIRIKQAIASASNHALITKMEMPEVSVWKFSTQNCQKTGTVLNCTASKPVLPVPVL